MRRIRFGTVLSFLLASVSLAIISAHTSQSFAANREEMVKETLTDVQKLEPRLRCNIRFAHYHQHDWRIALLEKKGIDHCGLFNGRKISVHSALEFARIANDVHAGDQIVLEGSKWRDQQISFIGWGKTNQPILIRAGKDVVLTGNSIMHIYGDNLILYRLRFANGSLSNAATVLKIGDANRPCNDTIVDGVSIDNYNTPPDRWNTTATHYLTMNGTNNTVTNCKFTNKENKGTELILEMPNNAAQYLSLYNNVLSGFATKHKRTGETDEYKFVELGSSHLCARPAYSGIENNRFEKNKGGGETISIKACDVIVARNEFVANDGGFNLRSCDRVLVANNLFDGAGQDNMGGVRIEGRDHWIVGNDFRNLVNPREFYYWPIAMQTGSDVQLLNGEQGYSQVTSCVVAKNKFENCQNPAIAVGIYPDAKRRQTLVPNNVYIEKNTFSAMKNVSKSSGIDMTNAPIFYVEGKTKYPDIHVQ